VENYVTFDMFCSLSGIRYSVFGIKNDRILQNLNTGKYIISDVFVQNYILE